MIFVLIAALMVAVAGACVVVPLVKSRHAKILGTANAEVTAHKHALEKMDKELERGGLTMPEYLTARTALERDFQVRLAQLEPAVTAAPKPRHKTAVAAALVMVILVGGLYLSVGNWRAAFGGNGNATQTSEQQMVAELAHRLATTDSRDANGWMMLGRSYVVMGRYTEAVPAYAHAYALVGDGNAELLADYAEAIILSNPAKLTTTAVPLLEKALRKSPDNAKALWYSGLLALAQHNRALAIRRWQKLLDQDPPQGIRQLVVQHIQEAGGTVSSMQASNQVADKLIIPVHIILAPRFAKRVPVHATLFVFARPTGSHAGPPLLATRLQVEKLPADLELTEHNAMLPGTLLHGYRQLDVVARLSLKGDASPHPGDLEGHTLFKLAAQGSVASITINRVVP